MGNKNNPIQFGQMVLTDRVAIEVGIAKKQTFEKIGEKYYRSAQKKDRKQKVKKVYQLFTMLESENGSLKALSIGQ